jgi:hypothetical protein
VTCARQVLAIAALAAAAACAPKLAVLPSGPGAPFPEYATAYEQAGAACRDVRTLAAVLTISGRAAGQRFPRSSVDAGFEAPDKALLDLPAPGRSIFTFAASGGEATLVLGREGRVLRNAPPGETLEALTGVRLGPGELRAIVAGCGFGGGAPSAGRAFGSGRAAVDAGPGVIHLEQIGGQWRIAGATQGGLEVRYADFAGGRPSTIRLRTAPADASRRTDLTIRTSQVDVNQAIDPRAFAPEIPAGAKPLTLDELRQAGPLGR